MKTLTYAEMLELPEGRSFAHKENEALLRSYLTRAIYGRKCGDFNFGEAFEIRSAIAVLSVLDTGSTLEATEPKYERLVGAFRSICDVKNRVCVNTQKLSVAEKSAKSTMLSNLKSVLSGLADKA